MPRNSDVSPDDPVDQQPVIGLIGMGDMGRMYVKHLSSGGWKRYAHSRPPDALYIFDVPRIHVCDQPTKYLALKHEYEGNTHLEIVLFRIPMMC